LEYRGYWCTEGIGVQRVWGTEGIGVQRHGLTVQGYDIRFRGTVLKNRGTILGTGTGVTVWRYEITVEGHGIVV